MFMTFFRDVRTDVGALGSVTIRKGEYCYIGSAKNGLDQRIARHMSKDKKIHWHIDHLTIIADVIEAFDTVSMEECELRKAAGSSGMVPAVKGFGCSDCRCDTHLLMSDGVSKRRFIEDCSLSGPIRC